MKIKIKKLYPDAKLPYRATAGSLGVDLYAYIGDESDRSLVVSPGRTAIVHTGLSVEMPTGYGGFIFARSSIATKHHLTLINSVGIIDNDYRGEIMVHMVNLGDTKYTINDGDRFAQFTVLALPEFDIEEAAELSETARGTQGFGSTGV
ncbi:deoxyuridine 5'-triphosphate nucleotidohydrolase [Clostridia bacterium]|nr:deoxyuridine 5'-triphosphate nucleotidohydrolase [Clostridia bacterium]